MIEILHDVIHMCIYIHISIQTYTYIYIYIYIVSIYVYLDKYIPIHTYVDFLKNHLVYYHNWKGVVI